jgi:PAS domain-containing protein
MPDAVLIVEVPSLRILFANRFAETLTQRRLGRPSKLGLRDLEGEVLRPDGRRYEQDDWPIMRATRGEKVADEDVLYRLEDGTTMTIRISAAPVHDCDGGIVAAVALGRDVSEQDGGDSASLGGGL